MVNNVAPTPDGGYLISGYTSSMDGDVSGNHGGSDVWAIKIDANGSKLWAKCFGGSANDNTYGMVVNNDGTAVLALQTNSSDGDITGSHGNGSNDACLIKIDADGNKQWVKCFGGSGTDGVDNVVRTSNGYLVAGETNSTDGDITQNHGNYDIYLLKTDLNGNKQWLKTYGGSGVEDNAYGLVYNQDGTIALAAQSNSNDGDVQGNHGVNDIWFLKINANGAITNSKCFGGALLDYPADLAVIPGGYALVGSTNSTDGDMSGNHGQWDGYLLKLDNAGNKQSVICYGGSNDDFFNGILPTDRTLLLTGYTTSTNGDITDHAKGNKDYWIHNILQ